MKRLRIMDGHSLRVGSLSWNSYIITSGSRSGQIIHHDVRQREHLVATLNSHSHEVCVLLDFSKNTFVVNFAFSFCL